uniref:hypothetical protein n=1 Tax=Azospirillum argentinense TaxID=2970906 RepID=UPI001585F717|nr:hypothetical protein [Azospirillum argentinense]
MSSTSAGAFTGFKDFVCENLSANNNHPSVVCRVSYKASDVNIATKSKVDLLTNTTDFGKIRISENDDLDANEVHLDFDTKYQNYKFDEDSGALYIYGSSPKMNGSYTVVLTPVEEVQ